MIFSRRIVFIAGPTAVGKSDAAFHFARMADGEIVSCDAMQVYKEMAIASNRPPEGMLKAVKHHLIGTVSAAEDYDVARYRQEALAAIESIWKRGRLPVVAGGTGMYMQILIDGIFEAPPADAEIRKDLVREAQKKGNVILYERLKTVDPETAAKLHPNDARRIIRALEVYAAQGRPISELQKDRRGLWDEARVEVYVLEMDREDLYGRINQRVDRMLEQGLVEEIRALDGVRLSKTAGAVIGVKEIGDYLNGRCSLEEAGELIKKRTRNLAKRQVTWFKKDPRWKRVRVVAGSTAEDTAKQLFEDYGPEKS